MTAQPLADPTAAADLTPPAARRPIGPDVGAVVALVVGTLVIYARTASYDFVNYDDQVYVYQNPHVLGGLSVASLWWATTAIVSSNWHPLTLWAELAISTLFGPRPAAFHVVSAILHATNVALLFVLLRRATGRFWPAVLAAALWGWHPLRVESVAWVSELKDVLCGTGFLLALLAYVGYDRRRTPGRYAAVAGLLVLALLAKPMAVTLPFVLLLLDAWPLGTDRPAGAGARQWWTARVAEKLPLVALAVADIVYAALTQVRTGAAGSLAQFSVGGRLANAAASMGVYLRQTVWPAGLAVFYPHPVMLGRSTPIVSATVGAMLALVMTAVAVAWARRSPFLIVGWLWFVGMLVPVIGLVQIGEQAHADRYTYLPSIGLTVAVVWGVAAAARTAAAARAAWAVGAMAAMAVAAVSVRDVRFWSATGPLFDRAAAIVPDNYFALSEQAYAQQLDGNADGSVATARRAVALAADRSALPHMVLGTCLLDTGRAADVGPALQEFITAAKIRRTEAAAWTGMGRAIERQAAAYAAAHDAANETRRDADAAKQYRHALALNPDDLEAAGRLGNLLGNHGDPAGAIDVLTATVAKYPDVGVAHGDLAAALQRQDRVAEAADQYRLAVAHGDDRPDTRVNLAWLLAINPEATPADLAMVAPIAKAACDDPEAGRAPFPWYAYSVVLARQARFDDATAAGQRALALARSTGQTAMAIAIQKRLAAFGQGMVVAPTSQPASGPTTAPVTPSASPAPGP